MAGQLSPVCVDRQIVSSYFSSFWGKVTWVSGGALTTSWLYYSPPLNPTVTSFSSVPCSNKHPGKKKNVLFVLLSTKVLWVPSSSFSLFLFAFPPFIFCWETCHDPMGAMPRPSPTKTNPTTHTERASWFSMAGRLRSVLTLHPLGCDCAAVYSWSPSVQTSQSLWMGFKKRLILFILLPKSRDPGLIPCSHSIKNNSPKSRKWLYQMAGHTEICSNTSAGFQSQGNTMLRQERRHKMCLSAGPWKTQ